MGTQSKHSIQKTIIFTILALIAFAANSVFCRMALGDAAIDAASFTAIRLLSGAGMLAVILLFTRKSGSNSKYRGSWFSSLMLFTYAICFSYAYITLDTGTGALILFGSVQISMIMISMISGNRLHMTEWAGVLFAFSGFVYLVLPEVTTPSFTGFLLMTLAGIAWGVYTLRGRVSDNALADTAFNFIRTLPIVLVLVVATLGKNHYSMEGVTLAVLSGAIASGVGYTIWYVALTGLSATQAAVVQLLVPVIAALGGVIFVFEPITFRLAVAGIMILGGILTVILGRYYLLQFRQT